MGTAPGTGHAFGRSRREALYSQNARSTYFVKEGTYRTGAPVWLTLQQQNRSSRTLRERLARHAMLCPDVSAGAGTPKKIELGSKKMCPLSYPLPIARVCSCRKPAYPGTVMFFFVGKIVKLSLSISVSFFLSLSLRLPLSLL